MPKQPGYKGMDPNDASLKKIAGHINESDYADLIGGQVNQGSVTDKKDVVDAFHRTHSVKSGKKWQIFLYSLERIENDITLQAFGNVAKCITACIDAVPKLRKDREKSYYHKQKSKLALQQPMRELAEELSKPDIFKAFFQKSAFEGSQVDFWAILDPSIDQTKASLEEKKFYIFDSAQCVQTICDKVLIVNSKARGKGHVDDQKVVFRIPNPKNKNSNLNIGEIEIRTDKSHYRRVKMWFEAERTVEFLQREIPDFTDITAQLRVYGKARQIKILVDPS